MRYYAIGDIHGRADLLAQLHHLIEGDLQNYSGAATLVYLGDYIDRGSDSKGVLEQLITCSLGTARVYLKGNHEDMLLEFLARPKKGQRWLNAGGLEAARSYGLDRTPDKGHEVVAFAKALASALPKAHLDFLHGLQLKHCWEQYYFCHAGVRPGIPLDTQDTHDLMWIKGDFLSHVKSFGKIIVHGHSPVEEVVILQNRINVDTRAHASGRLSCVVLEGASVRVIATRPKPSLRARLAAWLRDWFN